MLHQALLDFGELDPHAADLNLSVFPAQELNRAICLRANALAHLTNPISESHQSTI
ncbi:hypothetical protein PZN02_005884 (plasmid) [Sinorhizobium garamanticum]|uniref:Uncharacterized protein n=1 Tax=Sinorhizobium garamanticum TaxID=680247 RepID=A0ABY8DRS7_9HYPH|nr:hypothetical protein [Sinorhizobium garamanticum]WEX91618.1 hypothetical protein PZN02_005884 [Sinorhizobium garamanticum]